MGLIFQRHRSLLPQLSEVLNIVMIPFADFRVLEAVGGYGGGGGYGEGHAAAPLGSISSQINQTDILTPWAPVGAKNALATLVEILPPFTAKNSQN